MKQIVTIQILVFLFLFQSDLKSSPRKGDKYFNNFNFVNATKVYEKYLNKNPNDVATIEKIATSYRLLNDWQRAEPWYGKLIELGDQNSDNLFYYANSLRANQKYEQANLAFKNHFEKTGNTFSKSLILSDEEVLELLNPNGAIVKNLGINSPKSDFSPLVVNKTLYFTSNRNSKKFSASPQDNWKGSDFLNMFMVDTANENSFKSVKTWPLSKVNGRYHEGPVALHPNGDLYLTRTNYIKSKAEKSSDKTAKLKIFVLKKENESWSSKLVEGVDFNNKEYSISHATFNEDGSVMYFASDMPGGYGNTDIWKATFNGTTYSNPENLGPTINTIGDDMFPFFYNGNLYFSSSGWPGLGGLDIYMSSLDGKLPINIGAPFNSNFDDFGVFLLNEENGYFSSNRPGAGSDDIYKFERKLQEFKIYVYDLKTGEAIEGAKVSSSFFKEDALSDKNGEFHFSSFNSPSKDFSATLDGFVQEKTQYNKDGYFAKLGLSKPDTDNLKLQIFVQDFNTKEPISVPTLKLNGKTYLANENGFFTQEIGVGDTIDLVVEKRMDGADIFYFPEFLNFNTDNALNGIVKITVLLRKLEKGKEFVIKDIYYDLDKYSIRNDAAGQLNNLLAVLKDYSSIKIELRSHTDCRHSKAYNMNLSNNRAKSAMEYLVKNGISKNRMTFKGFGETQTINGCDCESDQPINKIGLTKFRQIEDAQVENCSENDHQMNRRTTFVITDF